MHKSIYECQIVQLLLLEEAAIICQKNGQICIDTVRGPSAKGIKEQKNICTLIPLACEDDNAAEFALLQRENFVHVS